mmetsp:Transcript_8215/g.25371  ORF Transcript_8215/g.25371 Transcript_8215/m.25371 type:complete len:342 (-) Transcript_8215:46-1071(-)
MIHPKTPSWFKPPMKQFCRMASGPTKGSRASERNFLEASVFGFSRSYFKLSTSDSSPSHRSAFGKYSGAWEKRCRSVPTWTLPFSTFCKFSRHHRAACSIHTGGAESAAEAARDAASCSSSRAPVSDLFLLGVRDFFLRAGRACFSSRGFAAFSGRGGRFRLRHLSFKLTQERPSPSFSDLKPYESRILAHCPAPCCATPSLNRFSSSSVQPRRRRFFSDAVPAWVPSPPASSSSSSSSAAAGAGTGDCGAGAPSTSAPVPADSRVGATSAPSDTVVSSMPCCGTAVSFVTSVVGRAPASVVTTTCPSAAATRGDGSGMSPVPSSISVGSGSDIPKANGCR